MITKVKITTIRPKEQQQLKPIHLYKIKLYNKEIVTFSVVIALMVCYEKSFFICRLRKRSCFLQFVGFRSYPNLERRFYL